MRFLITAGPTREPLDPVRFLSNRSTGKMGFALAQAAAEAGHEVVLVAGPVALETPPGVRRVDIETALEMLAAVERELPAAEVYISCAAVADWRPEVCSPTKLKKREMAGTLRRCATPIFSRRCARSRATAPSSALPPKPANPMPKPRANSARRDLI